MKISKTSWIISAIFSLVTILGFLIPNKNISFLVIGIGILFASFPFIFSIIYSSVIDQEKEEMFLEFTRNLVESVKTGTPINKSIINLKNKNYGVLTPYINKLANQIYLGIPLTKALKIFSNELNNKTILKAVTLIGQAEESGGNIGEILESVTEAVNTTEKLKKERKATLSTLVVQGYIIFFIFIIIILVMQFKIIPMISTLSSNSDLGGKSMQFDSRAIANSFLYLLLTQGFFSGLVIGKLSEGSIKSGLKHSLSLMVLSFLISATANIIFGK